MCVCVFMYLPLFLFPLALISDRRVTHSQATRGGEEEAQQQRRLLLTLSSLTHCREGGGGGRAHLVAEAGSSLASLGQAEVKEQRKPGGPGLGRPSLRGGGNCHFHTGTWTPSEEEPLLGGRQRFLLRFSLSLLSLLPGPAHFIFASFFCEQTNKNPPPRAVLSEPLPKEQDEIEEK